MKKSKSEMIEQALSATNVDELEQALSDELLSIEVLIINNDGSATDTVSGKEYTLEQYQELINSTGITWIDLVQDEPGQS